MRIYDFGRELRAFELLRTLLDKSSLNWVPLSSGPGFDLEEFKPGFITRMRGLVNLKITFDWLLLSADLNDFI